MRWMKTAVTDKKLSVTAREAEVNAMQEKFLPVGEILFFFCDDF